MELQSKLRQLELASVIEGTTLVLPIAGAVPLKYLGGWAIGVQILGPLHGLALLIYMWIAIHAVADAGRPRGDL